MAGQAQVVSSAWLRDQWHNPSDIFTILLIIGGEVVQIAIAQLCAGRVSFLAPVTFSFGWVSYAVSTALRAVGDNRLMPKPELDCILINAKTGHRRPVRSWVLSRMLRDFDYWKPRACDEIEAAKLRDLQKSNVVAWSEYNAIRAREEKSKPPAEPEDVRVGLRVSVWECMTADGKGSGDIVYWSGLLVSAAQLGIAVVPWGVDRECFTFAVTAAGTALAYLSGALPQWQQEKVGVRSLQNSARKKERKDVILTEGNGGHDVLLILGCEGGLDLEALAGPQRKIDDPWFTRLASITLATLWLALLISVAGWSQNTWYLLGIGLLGLVHNVIVAGMKRQPWAWGINLRYVDTIVERKVMEVLLLTEGSYPSVGRALLEEFFPGKLYSREQLIWDYTERRYEAWIKERSNGGNARRFQWELPPCQRPRSRQDDSDIPQSGPFVATGGP
ncbi:hypothetical protein LTR37_011811 [Vermiconidia calcicola]|uniref:Uncharacterized protein n=1 Tax=Vermiconidia calcicola TaxID=1690605 RepID=A0ACC3N1E4_9PEZI|nr:hypothetical protein LTR37_011811 [Vermiconidia calcicola]